MKFFGKISIRLRLTFLTGFLIFLTSFSITLLSQRNADLQLVKPLIAMNVVPLEKYESAIPLTDSMNPSNLAMATIIASDAKQNFDMSSYNILIFTTLIGMILAYFISKKALSPLTSLNEHVLAIDEHNLVDRIPEQAQKDEIATLSQSFNEMLNRLECSFDRQRRFSSNVAHELKTPLATIQAAIQVLELDESPTLSDYQENTAIIQNNIQRLNQVVNNLFDLSLDNYVSEAKPLLLRPVFERILNDLKVKLDEKKIEVELHCKEEIFICDAVMIERAFFNLIENAIKYNKQNGRIIINVLNKKGKPCFEFIDTGIGIPKNELAKITEPFYRVDPSRSREIAGAGLGLSIVLLIMEKHHYQLHIESKVHEGTKISVFPYN